MHCRDYACVGHILVLGTSKMDCQGNEVQDLFDGCVPGLVLVEAYDLAVLPPKCRQYYLTFFADDFRN